MFVVEKYGMFYNKKKNNKSGAVDVVLLEDSCWDVGAGRGSEKPCGGF